MKTSQSMIAVDNITAISKKSTKKLQIIAVSAMLAIMGVVDYVVADITGSIPDYALSKGGKKVTICHFPPGNPDNYQVITISTSALNTHVDHHDDVFANDGICPAITKPFVWQYLNGPGSWDPATGKPNALENLSGSIPSDILTTLQQRLQEGQSAAGNPATGSLINYGKGASVNLKGNAGVKVSYLTEGAGYTNSVGYFNFSTDKLDSILRAELGALWKDLSLSNKIIEKVIFPNDSSNVLQLGDAVNLGNFNAGTSIGFTIVANGWKSDQGKVDDNVSDRNIFRTINNLNPETAQDNLDAHAVLFADPAHELLIVGFEDLNRTSSAGNSWGLVSDNDFNDVVIAIHVSPFSAVDLEDINLLNQPALVSGESGPSAWREVTTPDSVIDTVKAAKRVQYARSDVE